MRFRWLLGCAVVGLWASSTIAFAQGQPPDAPNFKQLDLSIPALDLTNVPTASANAMAEANTHKLKLVLGLRWLQKNDYEATVSVTITDSCYHEGDLTLGLPPGMAGIPEIEYLTYSFTHDEGKTCSDLARVVKKSIQIQSSSGKTKVEAFAVVNGNAAGSDIKPFPR